MPFRSIAQQGFMFAKHPDIAKRWAAETPNIKTLPEHVQRKQAIRDRVRKLAQEQP